jgi:hypothetical protein
MQHTDSLPGRRVGRRFAIGAGLMAVTLLVGLFATTVASAAPSPDDPRAELHEGNATTCAQVGFAGDQILGSGGNPQASGTVTQTPDGSIVVTISDHTGGGQEINVVLDPNSGVVIDTIIVKGGNAYNQYPGTVLDHLIAPFVGNNEIPNISHWFLCYHQGTPPTTAPPTTAPTTTAAPRPAGRTGPVPAPGRHPSPDWPAGPRGCCARAESR